MVLTWVLLLGAALLEPVWATAIKYSDGFSKFWPSVFGLAGALASVVLLALAMKTMPAGTAYAVFVGIGAVSVAIAGVIAFQEVLTLPRMAFLALIVVGVIGLNASEA